MAELDTDKELMDGIRRVLTYLPRFEEPGFVFGTWKSPKAKPGVVQLGWFDLSDTARAWIHAVYESKLMLRGFDWGNWQQKAQAYLEEPELMDTANLDTLRKLLVTHLRKDRFCEGHLASMYECGHLTAIMRRLGQIAEQMGGLS